MVATRSFAANETVKVAQKRYVVHRLQIGEFEWTSIALGYNSLSELFTIII